MPLTLVLFDCLPTSLIGCYGAEWSDTPALDLLAAQGLTLEGLYATHTVLDEQREQFRGALEPARGRWQSLVVGDNPREVKWDLAGAKSTLARVRAPSEDDIAVFTAPGVPPVLSPPEDVCDLFFEELIDPAELLHWSLSRGFEIDSPSGDLESLDWFPALLPQLVSSGLLQRDEPAQDRVHGGLRKALAAVFVAVADRQLTDFVELWTEATRGEPESLLIVTALTGCVLHDHPVIREGMPPLVHESLHLPCWITGGPWTGRSHRLVSSRGFFGDLGAVARRVRPASDVLEVLQRWEDGLTVISHTPEGARSLRTEHWRYVQAGSSTSEEWLFRKPEDVWDLLDVAGQHPLVLDEFAARPAE